MKAEDLDPTAVATAPGAATAVADPPDVPEAPAESALHELAGGADPREEVVRYNFHRPPRLGGPLHRASESLFRRVVFETEAALSEDLRTRIALDLRNCRPLPCVDLCGNESVLVYPVLDEGGLVQGIISMDLSLAAAIVDRLLGGEGATPATVGPVTGLSDFVLRSGLDRVAYGFERAIGLESRTFRIGEPIRDVHKSLLVSADERYLVGEMELRMKACAGGVRVGIPQELARARVAQLVAREDRSGTGQRTGKALREAVLANVLVEGHVRLGEAAVLIHRIQELAVGDVIVLDRRVREGVDLTVDGVVVARGRLGLRGETMAFQVTAPASPADGTSGG